MYTASRDCCRAQGGWGCAEPGAAQVVDASDPSNIRLKIRPDPFCRGDNITHFQCGLVAHLLGAQEEAYLPRQSLANGPCILPGIIGGSISVWPEQRTCL